MSFMLALPKISLHRAGAIGDMVNLVANKQMGKSLIVTDGQLVKLGLLWTVCSPRWINTKCLTTYSMKSFQIHRRTGAKRLRCISGRRMSLIIAFGGGGDPQLIPRRP